MEKNRGVKVVAVAALIVAVIGLTIAYASLSATLNITGTANVVPANWDVHFESPTVEEQLGTGTGEAPTLQPPTTLENFTVTLKKPGDSVTFKFDVVNGGDINAKLTDLTMPTVEELTYEGTAGPDKKSTDEDTVKQYLEYKLTDEGGSPITQDSLTINATQRKTMKLTMTYKQEADKLPSAQVDISNLDVTMIFTQAD